MQSSTNLIDWLPIETLSTHTATGLWNAYTREKDAFFRLEKINSTTTVLQSGVPLEVIQSWSQEQNYTRTTKVIVPAEPRSSSCINCLAWKWGKHQLCKSI